MPGTEDPREADVEEANSKLSDGLKSCRVVVDSYRAMLAGDQASAAEGEQVPAEPTGEPPK